MITIAIANHKGGVTKTTAAVVLAQGLARQGQNVLIVDTDAQGHVAEYIGMPPADDLFNLLVADQPIAQCIHYSNGTQNIAVVRSSQKTAAAKVTLAAMHAPIDKLAFALQPLADRADYCLIDTAPSLDALGLATIYAADYVLVPTLPERLGLHGVKKVVSTIKTVCTRFQGHTQLLGIIPAKYRANTKEHQTNLRDLVKVYGRLVYPVVPLATAVAEAVSFAMSLWDYDPRGKATIAYRQILARLLRETHGQE